jgi:hypothetical protein
VLSEVGSLVDDQDILDPARPLQGEQARLRARQRTLYLAASLLRRGFDPDVGSAALGEHPNLRYLHRFVSLVRLVIHAETLFTEILPAIRDRLTFRADRYVERRPFQARGAVDWAITLREGWTRAERAPTILVSRRPNRDYATPENVLTALTLATVRADAGRLLHTSSQQLDPTEVDLLRRVVAASERTARVPQLRTLDMALDEDLRADPFGVRAAALETDTLERARHRPRAMGPYRELVEWRRRYRSWLTDAQRSSTRLPYWAADDNQLYEVLVLFELANAFSGRAVRSVQRRAMGSPHRPVFSFRLPDGRELELWYQSSHGLNTYTEVRGVPDVIFRIHGRTILGDMKNYSVHGYTQAVYKMLGYLYNYGYPDRWSDIDAGVLFFPSPKVPRFPGFRILDSVEGLQDVGALIISPGGVAQDAGPLNVFVDWVLARS